VALAAARPDFSGALAQLLIGLVQTTAAPESGRDWRAWYDRPPTPEELAAALAPVAYAFELDGDGARFMQDLTLFGEEHSEECIEQMLIDAPGGNTLKLNKDLFVKRYHVDRLCPDCAAAAVLTLQTNAPGGGQGHRVGLRGGGPLTTLVYDDESLWRTIWLNVLDREDFLDHCGNPTLASDEAHFPWLVPTRTSEPETGRPITPEDAHPNQVYWSTPRRLRLAWASDTDGTVVACALCGAPAPVYAATYAAKNYGVSYVGWRHPLSPYYKTKDETWLPLHPQPGGIHYRHWMGLVQFDADRGITPARVVRTYLDDRASSVGRRLRLWAFGYDMDNMKARCWYEGMMPLVVAPPAVREAFESDVACLIRATMFTCQQTLYSVKASISDQPKKVKGDLGAIEQSIWQATESGFFGLLTDILSANASGEPTTELRQGWLRGLVTAANAEFEIASQAGYFDAVDAGRVAEAWNALQRSLHGPKMRQILLLPEKRKA
jgi:CRISPR system Cascade subunit CasA